MIAFQDDGPKCGDCKYWHMVRYEIAPKPQGGECRRSEPPWTPTKSNDWCGDHPERLPRGGMIALLVCVLALLALIGFSFVTRD